MTNWEQGIKLERKALTQIMFTALMIGMLTYTIGLFALIIMAQTTLPAQAPEIVSISPTQNELNVPVSTEISVTFDVDMDETTINEFTFVVNARSTGLHQGTITYNSGTKTATLDLSEDFDVGEVVTVVLTTDIQSSLGVPLDSSYVWSFTAMVNNGYGTFAPDSVYPVSGEYAHSIFAADLDGDSDIDLATANWNSGDASVLLNNGDGTFTLDSVYVVGDGASRNAAADLDGDGDIDLATANHDPDNVAVLLNNGDGSFASASHYPGGGDPWSIFAADLDGDGDIDLAIENGWYGHLSVLLNNGDATFGPYVIYPVGGFPCSIFAADLDGDGDLDLSTAKYWGEAVAVLMNNGDGTFASAVAYPVGDHPFSVFAVDLDGDGDLDLTCTNRRDNNVSVLLNNGDGTFGPHEVYAVGDDPFQIFAADLDGDGDLDLITANADSDDISVLLNNGDGTFASHSVYPVGDMPFSVFAADLDGDGDLDLAVANELSDNVSVLLNEESPACQVSPTSLDFGTVSVGSYLDKTFSITNTGLGTLSGAVSESCDHYSIVSGEGPYSLGAGESVTVTVRFEPTSLGQHNCTIETGNDLCGDVSCTGVGGSPCQVSPTSLSFGTVTVGSYLYKTFKITNIGGETLTGTVSESCDHYDIVSGGGAYSLEPGDSVIVTVRFEPASPGQHNCTIETGNDLCSDVLCSGTGATGDWYWKSAYEDYAPSGMPDIDQKQDNWMKEETGQWTFCGPCAVANCFKWFDSKYNEGLGGWPGDGMDAFPLVRDYMDQLAPFSGWDDHDPWNVDHVGTQWNPGVGWPPETDQPFLPGPQPQPSPMPPWGELVERLAWYFDTDGIQTGYCSHAGTNILQMQQGIQDWLESETFEDGNTLADTLCAVITARPTFAYVESLVEKSENVILLLGFWYSEEGFRQPEFQEFIRGEINEDGMVDLGDWIMCVTGGPFSCDDAADVNDDGVLNMADCVYLSNYIFQGGPPPPSPFPDCGTDPTPDELDCGSFALCGSWWRVGGHYVTVAGVNSTEQKIAVSDPFIDAAELGLAEGRVGDGWLIEHVWGEHDPTVHNDEGNVSHDMYVVDTSSISPGGDWWLPEYPRTIDPFYPMTWWMGNFFNQNVPDEFVDKTQEWDEVSPIFTEVEYCIHVSPWDYRGDVNIPNGDGIVELGDIVFLINYVFKSGPAPVPYWEGDVNCDGVIELGDIVFLINYVFKNGPVPRCCDP